MDHQNPANSTTAANATATATTTAVTPTTTTTATVATVPNEPSSVQSPQQQQQPSPLQPPSTTAPSTSATPVTNPIPSPLQKPPTLMTQPQPTATVPATATRPPPVATTTKTPIVHRPWQHQHPHANYSHFSVLPSSSTISSSISSPASAPPQRANITVGVPASHTGPSPAPFSSTFGQQFGGLNRGGVSLNESGASTNKPQVRPGMQGIGMMGTMTSSSQMRPGGLPSHHQQRPAQSSIRPSVSTPTNQSPTTQSFQGHSFLRSSSAGSPNSPLPSTSQSMQSATQPWLSSGTQGKPPLPSPSYRPQTNSPSLQQRAHIPQQHQAMSTTSQQQHTQPTQPVPSHQPTEHYGQHFPPSRIPPSVPHQQQVTRVQGVGSQKPASLATAQHNTLHPVTQSRTMNTESDESGNRILNKRTIQQLVSQIDPSEKLDPEVEDILMDIAEDFVESITTFGCSLAKHRKSDTLEGKDILLHVERNWNMTLPGFGGDEIKTYRKPVVNDTHKERLAVVKKSILTSEMANSKSSAGQAAGNVKGNITKGPVNTLLTSNSKVI
ncbi:hypothetical protein K2173_001970 [Erythroxylum novogranatense]|uniref:Transcription initiation factor TFIID subunit 12 domain-containing protein n=1 Tax=Erythroxylum novogranatense TaxID=1862640 RepID=A0AAV8SP38_9ROSI|nr:hypothetical protein K2173_001970 [Erythroxylum novogranatense]